MTVLALSDVPLGFGSPQVLRISEAIAKFVGEPLCIIAPPGGEVARAAAKAAEAALHEIAVADPLSYHAGEAEFALLAARRIDQVRPRFVVLFAFLGAPAILFARWRPKRIVYVGYEHTDGRMQRMEAVFKALRGRFSLAIFPEPFRAVLDRPRLSLQSCPLLLLENGAPNGPSESFERAPRLAYAGRIDAARTYGDDLVGGALSRLPIDLYGPLVGTKPPSQDAGAQYHGVLPAGPALSEAVSRAAACLVMWRPVSESTYFAAPNKAFEAVAHGTPVVAAPHPQLQCMIEAYGCGVVAESFAPRDISRAADVMLASFGSDAYKAFCLGAQRAQQRYGWPAQLQKLYRAIESWRRA